MKRRILAFLMAILMLFMQLPVPALAALIDNEPEYNQEILSELTRLSGSQKEGEQYYALLEKYGLLNEDGRVMESWTVTMDGKDITLNEIREVLKGDYDPSKLVIVDGTPISLGDLDTIIKIEEYIAYLRQTYFSGEKWTDEHYDSLESLQEQINNEGIMLLRDSPSNTTTTIGDSGIDHGARISISEPERKEYSWPSRITYTYTVTLNKAEAGQTVTFKWRALSGSRPVTGSGDITLDSTNKEKEIVVELEGVSPEGANPVRATDDTVFYLNLYDIKNALFSNNKRVMSLEARTEGTIEANQMPKSNFTVELNKTKTLYTFEEPEKKAINWGMINSAKLVDIYGQNMKNDLGSTYELGLGMPPIVSTEPLLVTEYNYIDCNVRVCGKTAILHKGYVKDSQSIKLVELNGDANHPLITSVNFTPENVNQGIEYNCNFLSHWISGEPLGSEIELFYLNDQKTWVVYYAVYKKKKVDAKIEFSDNKAPIEESITAPSGRYYPGEIVPITVRFSEPVNPDATITANERVIKPVERGVSNVLTFPYEVQEPDNAEILVTGISATDISGNSLTQINSSQKIGGVTLEGIERTSAIIGMDAEIKEPLTDPLLEVSASVSDSQSLIDWMTGDFLPKNGMFESESFFVKVKGDDNYYPLISEKENIKGQILKAAIPLPLNTSDAAKTYVPELYIFDKDSNTYDLIIGRYAVVNLEPAKFVAEDDINLSVEVLKADGSDYEYADETKTIYVQENPKISEPMSS